MDSEPKFKVGDIVLYHQYGDEFSLGEIKEVFTQYERSRLKQDGMLGPATGPEIKTYKYSVYYHTGDTAAITDERSLVKINNLYAFNIKRKRCN